MRYIVAEDPRIQVKVYDPTGVIGTCEECIEWRVGSEKLAFSNTTFNWLLQACRIHQEKHEKHKAS